MPCFRGLQRTLITVLSLSLLLLTDGLPVGSEHVAVATDDPDVYEIALPEDISGYTCASGFADIDSKIEMSLHGVTLMGNSALAVGYTRSRINGDIGRRRPASLLNRNGSWTRVWAGTPGREDGLTAVASKPGSKTWAVGFMTVEGHVMPLAMRWNGQEWKADRPRPRTKLTSLLTDVIVVGDGNPLAVGYRMTSSGKQQPIIVRKYDNGWRYLKTPKAKGLSLAFAGIGADQNGGAWVVGYGGSGAQIGPAIYRRADKKWQRLKVPRLKGEAALNDVVATGPHESWAVGYHRHDGHSEPLVLRWDGKNWKKAPAPAFDSREVLLRAVTADPAGGIWVVGAAWDDVRKSHVAVAAWWDGQAWNEVSGPAGGTELHDVIGSLDEDGWAVGRSGSSSRATRVCTPAQSGVFGGIEPGSVEPLPTPPLATGGQAGDAAAAGSQQSTKKPSAAKKAIDEARAVAAQRAVKTGNLPVATKSKAIYALDVAREVGLYEETGTYDGVVADFDVDGDDDIFIGRHGRKGHLLLNDGGTFTEHLALKMKGIDRHGCTSADIDGSGLPDLYCAVGGKRGSGLKSNELWLDPGGDAPVEVAAERGLADPAGRGRLAAFLEAVKQDDTQLVVTNSPTRVDGLPSVGRSFVTDGDGRFTAKARPGFASQLGSLALRDVDYDGDGREDLLLVTGGPQAPQREGTWLYRNTPRGLVDVTRKLGIKHFGEVDAELIDLNRDGRLDLVQLSETRLRVSIFKKGKFRKVYQRKLTHGRAIAGGDVNGDNRGDIYIVRGHVSRNHPDVMLVNRHGGVAWDSVMIPQTSDGDGDDAYAIDHDGNGLDDFLVLNGHNKKGPVQLIAFYPRAKR